MTPDVRRGLALLAMAFGALLLGAVATSNDAPTLTTQVLGLLVVLLFVGAVASFVLAAVRRRGSS